MRFHVLGRLALTSLALYLCASANAAIPKNMAKPKPKLPANKGVQLAPYTESIPGTLVKFDMVGIPAGDITIADPAKPGATKKVKVDAMWAGKSEVTWDEYDVFVFRLDDPNGGIPATGQDALSHPSKPYGMADRGYGHKGYPAIDMSFQGAQKYCEWLSQKTGHQYRLPTEAEYEYLCRANQPIPGKDQLADYAWFWQEKTNPVAQKKPNAFGLYDTLGNVAEWALDLTGKSVACGSGYDDMAKDTTPARRRYQDDSWQANDPQSPKSKWWLSDTPWLGFRVVRTK